MPSADAYPTPPPADEAPTPPSQKTQKPPPLKTPTPPPLKMQKTPTLPSLNTPTPPSQKMQKTPTLPSLETPTPPSQKTQKPPPPLASCSKSLSQAGGRLVTIALTRTGSRTGSAATATPSTPGARNRGSAALSSSSSNSMLHIDDAFDDDDEDFGLKGKGGKMTPAVDKFKVAIIIKAFLSKSYTN